MSCQGISIGLTTRVGTLLGEGRVAMAKRLSKFCVCFGITVVLCTSSILLIARDGIIGSFSRDHQVMEQTRHIWSFLVMFVFLDGTMGVQRGVLLGLGLQFWMSVSMIVSLWVVGLPLMRYLTFGRHMGLGGIWLALPIIYVLLNVLLALSYLLQSWEHIAAKIQRHKPPAEGQEDKI